MNKTKLEVVRIDEDVIATSGVKNLHEGTAHCKLTSSRVEKSGGEQPRPYGYNYNVYLENGSFTYGDFATDGSDLANLFATGSVGDWYYWDSVDSCYKKCDDPDHSYYYDLS